MTFFQILNLSGFLKTPGRGCGLDYLLWFIFSNKILLEMCKKKKSMSLANLVVHCQKSGSIYYQLIANDPIVVIL